MLILVSHLRAVENAAPFDVEGHLCELREPGRKHSGQGAPKIVIIRNRCGEAEARLTGAEAHVDAVARDECRPENPVCVDVRVVVVNLVRSNWTVENVESDEPERRVVMLAIDRRVFADHEAHVRLIAERRQAGAGSDTANAVQTDEAVEVGDL